MVWALIRALNALSRCGPASEPGSRMVFDPRESWNRTRLPTESNHSVTVVLDESRDRNWAVTRVAPEPRLRVREHWPAESAGGTAGTKLRIAESLDWREPGSLTARKISVGCGLDVAGAPD